MLTVPWLKSRLTVWQLYYWRRDKAIVKGGSIFILHSAEELINANSNV
jgi:hypothetical protein